MHVFEERFTLDGPLDLTQGLDIDGMGIELRGDSGVFRIQAPSEPGLNTFSFKGFAIKAEGGEDVIRIDNTSGTFTFDDIDVTTGEGTTSIALDGVDGTFTVMNSRFTGPGDPGPDPSSGIEISNSSGTFHFDSLSLVEAGSSAIRINDTSGSITYSGLEISETGWHGLAFDGVAGTMNMTDVTVTGAGGNGIDLLNSGAGTFTFSDLNLSGSGDAGFRFAKVDHWNTDATSASTSVTVRSSVFDNNPRGLAVNLVGTSDFTESGRTGPATGRIDVNLPGNSFGETNPNLLGVDVALPEDPTSGTLTIDIDITNNTFMNVVDIVIVDPSASPDPNDVQLRDNSFVPFVNEDQWRATPNPVRVHAVGPTPLLNDIELNNTFVGNFFAFDPDFVPGVRIVDGPSVANAGLPGQDVSPDLRNAVERGEVLVNDRPTFFNFDSHLPGSGDSPTGGVITGGYLFTAGDPNAEGGTGQIDFFPQDDLIFGDDFDPFSLHGDGPLPLATSGGRRITIPGMMKGSQVGSRPWQVIRTDAQGNALVAFVHSPMGHIVQQRLAQGGQYSEPVLIEESIWKDAVTTLALITTDGTALLALSEILESAGMPIETPGLPTGADLLEGLDILDVGGLVVDLDGEFLLSRPSSDGSTRAITSLRGSGRVDWSDPFFIDDDFSNESPPPEPGPGFDVRDDGIDLLYFGTTDRTVGLAWPPASTGSGLRSSQAPQNIACDSSDCVWIVAASSQRGSDATLYLVDPERIPDQPGLTVDPSADWADAITSIPNGHLGLGVDLADLNGDGWLDIVLGVPGGHPDDLYGDPVTSDERGVAYVVLGPLTSGDLSTKVSRVYGGSQPRERFGGDTEIADINGDGVLDITITSTLHRRPGRVAHSGMAFFFLGSPPVIDNVVPVGENTAIFGQNLDTDVLLDGVPAIVLAATPRLLLIEGRGESVEVRGLQGTARVGGSRIVELEAGLNLVGWTGATPIEDALATVEGAFDSVFTWNALNQFFYSFNPDAPAFINTLSELVLGDALWIQIADPNGAVWTQPDFDEARIVPLSAGLNLAMWTGPDGTVLTNALGAIAGVTTQVLVWDASSRTFRSFNTALPAALNTLQTLNFGDAFWIEVNTPTIWSQPAR